MHPDPAERSYSDRPCWPGCKNEPPWNWHALRTRKKRKELIKYKIYHRQKLIPRAKIGRILNSIHLTRAFIKFL